MKSQFHLKAIAVAYGSQRVKPGFSSYMCNFVIYLPFTYR